MSLMTMSNDSRFRISRAPPPSEAHLTPCPPRLKDFLEQIDDRRFVVDDQDLLRGRLRWDGRGWRGLFPGEWHLHRRQGHAEEGSLPTSLSTRISPVLAHDPVRERKPQAGSLADLLVVKKGSKTRERICGAIPPPVSQTSTSTVSRERPGRAASVRTRGSGRSSMAWYALLIRLRKTCSS